MSQCVESERRMLHHYIVNGKEELLRHVAKEMKLVSDEIESKEEFKERNANAKKKAIREMKLHGQFERETEEIKTEMSWN